MKAIVKSIIRCSSFSLIRLWLAVALVTGGMSAQALVIVPTFDSSITGDANAATIESTINTAIQFYEARFSDPITVTIEFQEISTAGLFGHSSWWYYNISYSQYRADLQSDSSTTNDTVALSKLPSGANNPATGSSTVRVKTSNLRAIGITGLNSGLAGGYDGIIGLHTSQLNLSRASINPSKGDLLATVEHEMDEVLGLASALDENATDPFPEDLFRYTSTGSRTFTTNGDNAYFSIDGTNLLARFNQQAGDDYGDWWFVGTHTPQVQDASATDGTTPNPKYRIDCTGCHRLQSSAHSAASYYRHKPVRYPTGASRDQRLGQRNLLRADQHEPGTPIDSVGAGGNQYAGHQWKFHLYRSQRRESHRSKTFLRLAIEIIAGFVRCQWSVVSCWDGVIGARCWFGRHQSASGRG